MAEKDLFITSAHAFSQHMRGMCLRDSLAGAQCYFQYTSTKKMAYMRLLSIQQLSTTGFLLVYFSACLPFYCRSCSLSRDYVLCLELYNIRRSCSSDNILPKLKNKPANYKHKLFSINNDRHIALNITCACAFTFNGPLFSCL